MRNRNRHRYTFTFHTNIPGSKIDEQEYEVVQISPEHPARTACNLANQHAQVLANHRQQRIIVSEVHGNALWNVDPKTTEPSS